MISRRTFLHTASVAVAGATVWHPLISFATDSGERTIAIPGEDGMIVRSSRFMDIEMPPEYAVSWITPVEHFFVRNHMHEPSTLEADAWTVTVGGEVEHPESLKLADLQKLEQHTVINTLECAGNGRGFHRPQVPGIQWQKGAVGNASFSGPRMRDVLQRAGIKSSGKHVMFHGLDEVPGKVPPFIRSIPIDKALDGDTLIATHMNGQPLTQDHGFPARAMIPGWIGAASCKWLSEIKILDKEFEGNFMKPAYRLPNHPVKPGEAVNPDDTHPVTSVGVKSLIALADDSILKKHATIVHGTAWAGEASVTKVEVSTDGGQVWHATKLGHQQAKYAWRSWSYDCKFLKPGDYTILSRATDDQGRTQPEAAVWNPSGYLYNAYDKVKFHVQA